MRELLQLLSSSQAEQEADGTFWDPQERRLYNERGGDTAFYFNWQSHGNPCILSASYLRSIPIWHKDGKSNHVGWSTPISIHSRWFDTIQKDRSLQEVLTSYQKHQKNAAHSVGMDVIGRSGNTVHGPYRDLNWYGYNSEEDGCLRGPNGSGGFEGDVTQLTARLEANGHYYPDQLPPQIDVAQTIRGFLDHIQRHDFSVPVLIPKRKHLAPARKLFGISY